MIVKLYLKFISSDPVYFYMLPSSIGSSPHPCHWSALISLYGDKFGSCPGEMRCVGPVWESWFIKYVYENDLFTLYAADQVDTALRFVTLHLNYFKNAFALDHREAGLHYKFSNSQGKEIQTVSTWRQGWDLDKLPARY